MCTKSFAVAGLDDERTAYEVEQYLTGLPSVEQARADFLADNVTIEYDESKADQELILDEIENAGCRPQERIDGVLDRLKVRFGRP